MHKVPKGSTVFRFYDRGNGNYEIDFERGDLKDYIWFTWQKSNWKSIEWALGNVDNDQFWMHKEAVIESHQLNPEKDLQAQLEDMLVDSVGELLDFVKSKHQLRSNEELTCPIHRKLASLHEAIRLVKGESW